MQNNHWQNDVRNPSFTWGGAHDDGSGIAGYYVYWGTNPNGTSSYFTTETHYDPSSVSSGTYYLRVRVKDNAGNRSSWTTLFIFRYDGNAPGTVTLVSPPQGYQTNSSYLNFIWRQASDNTSGVSSYTIEFSEGPQFNNPLIYTVSDTTFSRAFSDTTWYWRVKAIDAAGNEGAWSNNRNFTIDTSPPSSPQLIQPRDNDWLNSALVTFIWSNSNDLVSGDKSTPVRFILQVDNSLVDSALSETTYTTIINEGQHNWRVRAYDLAGNFSEWSPYQSFGIDTSGPIIDSVTYLNDTVRFSGPFPIKAWVVDSLSGVDSVYLFYRISPNNSFDSLSMTLDTANNRWNGEIPALSDTNCHNVSYYVKAVDNAGNCNSSNIMSFVAVDIEEMRIDIGYSFLIPPVITPQNGIYIKYNLSKYLNLKLVIYDVAGRGRWLYNLEISGKGKKTIKPPLNSGIYFLKIMTDNNNEVFTRKVVIAKD